MHGVNPGLAKRKMVVVPAISLDHLLMLLAKNAFTFGLILS
jgi:hypothetical protein